MQKLLSIYITQKLKSAVSRRLSLKPLHQLLSKFIFKYIFSISPHHFFLFILTLFLRVLCFKIFVRSVKKCFFHSRLQLNLSTNMLQNRYLGIFFDYLEEPLLKFMLKPIIKKNNHLNKTIQFTIFNYLFFIIFY